MKNQSKTPTFAAEKTFHLSDRLTDSTGYLKNNLVLALIVQAGDVICESEPETHEKENIWKVLKDKQRIPIAIGSVTTVPLSEQW
jgi:hypothetical protein